LPAPETALHNTSEQTLRSIGHMHEELAVVVCERAWKAAMTDLDNRMSRHFRE
jgi:hypothetical protein